MKGSRKQYGDKAIEQSATPQRRGRRSISVARDLADRSVSSWPGPRGPMIMRGRHGEGHRRVASSRHPANYLGVVDPPQALWKTRVLTSMLSRAAAHWRERSDPQRRNAR